MSGGVLSESANEFLDLVENYLSLPILIVMVLCTAHFIISQVLDIGFSVACAFESEPEPEPNPGETCQPLTSKIKEKFYNLACSLMPLEHHSDGPSTFSSPTTTTRRTRSNSRTIN